MSVIVLDTTRSRYRPIADYGAVGDGRGVALVSSEGSIDWWCPGRFDAPSVFGAILDDEVGGRFSLSPVAEAASRSRYVPDTNVLETEHATATGVVRVVDSAPFRADSGVTDSILLRRVTGVEGTVDMRILFAPRFQYGRVMPRFADSPQGLIARGAGEIMILSGAGMVRRRKGEREGRFTVTAGESVDIVLRHRSFDVPVPFAERLAGTPAELEAATVERWRAWADRTRFDGPDAPIVRRAALALKLLQYEENGAIVAAPTASLPEAIGGVRNWDYRYTWLRDGVLSAQAFHDLGHVEDAERFSGWLRTTLGEAPEEMRIMYTVSGSAELPERELPHLEGYRKSAPVRIGNGAVTQRQLDVYGEILHYLHAVRASSLDVESWNVFRRIADHVAATWREPDSGIWEMRCPPRHFVFSKAMAWVALDRAARIARETGMPADVAAWEREAAILREEILAEGYDAERGAFVQAYGFQHLDASNLLLPLVGFLDAKDPRMVATVDRTLEELTVRGLVYRYLDAGDGIEGHEATFAYCTFWLIEVLARQDRVTEARALFDSLVAKANHLGLFAEEIDAQTNELLGNFPQGFPHAGLIQAALTLREAEKRLAASG